MRKLTSFWSLVCVATLSLTAACGDDDTNQDAGDTSADVEDTGGTDTTPDPDTNVDTTAGDAIEDSSPDTSGPTDTGAPDVEEDTIHLLDVPNPIEIEVQQGDRCDSLSTAATFPFPWTESDNTVNYNNSASYWFGDNCDDSATGSDEYGIVSPDTVYAITPSIDTALVVTVVGDHDLGLTVTRTCGDSINACVDQSNFIGAGLAETVTFEAVADTTYYVHIDGSDSPPLTGMYTITVARAETCDDGVDNDGDGDVDCADSDCADRTDCDESSYGASACLPSDGVDDDDDGLTDCADPDCAQQPACDEGNTGLYPGGCSPTDGTDDDGDGLLDCRDPDCAGVPACNEANTALYPNGCSPSDPTDDDGDGLLNCADPDCAATPACNESNAALYPNGCTNGTDDDGDGVADCADADCADDPGCVGQGDSCADPLPLVLGTAVSADTGDFSPLYGIDPGNCLGANADLGGGPGVGPADVVYAFTPPATSKYTFSLTQSASFDNILYIVTDCDDIPSTCIAGRDLLIGDQEITIELVAGVTYFAIVDGYDSTGTTNTGTFALSVQDANPASAELICDDGLDNETPADGDTDCNDVDCTWDSACSEQCTDGIDNDLDANTDCADSDCFEHPNCNEAAGGAAACTDGADNDGNGLADCFDATCAGTAACPVPLGTDCADPIEVTAVPSSYTTDTCSYTDSFAVGAGVGCEQQSATTVGKDLIFKFTAPAPGDYAVISDDIAWDSIINVIDGSGGCPASPLASCLGGADFDPIAVSFTATAAGQTFYAIVDGWGDDCGPVKVDFVETQPETGNCTDGLDNNIDGNIDCGDPQCAGDIACNEALIAPGVSCSDGIDNDGDNDIDCADDQCLLADPIGCGVAPGDLCATAIPVSSLPFTQTYDTCTLNNFFNATGGGSGCAPNANFSNAPDIVFEFTAPQAGAYEVAFDNDAWDGIVNVVSGGVGCSIGSFNTCVGGADLGTPPTVSFTAAAGETFYVIGDGASNACGPVTVTIANAAPELGNCADGVDNDLDGDTDCDDAECDAASACNESLSGVGACSDSIDNDNDGLTDCDDVNCKVSSPSTCPTTTGDICQNPITASAAPFTTTLDTCGFTDAFVADGDGSCAANFDGSTAPDILVQYVAPAAGNYAAQLSNSTFGALINVLDGSLGCPSRHVESCVSGDSTGLSLTATFTATSPGDIFYVIVDGSVAGCGTADLDIFPVTATETSCTDGLDNDNDGSSDCSDSDCSTVAACDESSVANGCTDGADNDSDGATDCDDADCASVVACNEFLAGANACSDGTDNDGDQLTDCQDPNCKASPLAGCNPPQGDICSAPIPITTLPYTGTVDTCGFGADHSISANGGCIFHPGTQDVVFSYTPTFTGSVSVTVTAVGLPLGDLLVNVSNECVEQGVLPSCLAAADSFPSDPETAIASVTAGVPIYIYTADWNGCTEVQVDVVALP